MEYFPFKVIFHSLFMPVCTAHFYSVALLFFCCLSLPVAIDVVIDNTGRVFGLTAISTNHVAVYYGGVVQHQSNYVPLHTCTYFFFFSLEKFGCSVEIKLSKEIHKGRKGTKTPSPRRDNRRKQDCVLLGVVVVLLISRWGVHTAHDTYLISSPVSFRFSVYRVRRTSEKYRKCAAGDLLLLFCPRWRNFASTFHCLIVWYFSFLVFWLFSLQFYMLIIARSFCLGFIQFDQPP